MAWLPIRNKNISRRSRAGYRLVLECLEDRCLMASGFLQVNLASDLPGVAPVTDANLVNPWGLSYSPTGPFWIAEAGAGISDVLDGRANVIPMYATVPSAGGVGVGSPTGTVYNGTAGFQISANGNTRSSIFLFATQDGAISGWNGFVDPSHAVIAVDNSASGASYMGLAIAIDATGHTFLYAADFSHSSIDVFDSDFQPLTQPGAFQDPNLPAGYSPFNVQSVGNVLVVAYAKLNSNGNDEVRGAGLGVVDIYSTSGALVSRLATGGALNAPWGVALAPSNFGLFGGDLLIGNRGDGRISAFNPVTDQFVGQLDSDKGTPIAIPGLWAISFGNDHLGGAADTLFFAAGIHNEAHGLFGAIQAPGQHGADTGGPFGFDPDAPGEVADYPLPPTVGPRLPSDTAPSMTVVALQPATEGSLAIFPTITVVAQIGSAPSAAPAPGSVNAVATFFVSTAASAAQVSNAADIPPVANETSLALHSLLNVNAYSATPRETIAPTNPTDPRSSETHSADALYQRSSDDATDNLPAVTVAVDAEESRVPTRSGWVGLVRSFAMMMAIPVLWGYVQIAGRRGAADEDAASKLTLPLHLER
jgi:uncharacterized protein (TIGR03118 family)